MIGMADPAAIPEGAALSCSPAPTEGQAKEKPMRIGQIAVQMFSFREHIADRPALVATLRRLRAMGYRSLQLSAALPAMPEGELLRLLDDEGFLPPITAHAAAEEILTRRAALIARLQRLGVTHVAYPAPHLPLTSEAAVHQVAAALRPAAQELQAAGITLAYHNHAMEFARFGCRCALDILLTEVPELEAELDTFWCQDGGGGVHDWIEALHGRMRVIHLKDYGFPPLAERRHMLPVGSGRLDWARLLPAAMAAGVECFVVEHDGDCADPFVSFAASLSHLREHFVV
jgi:sugar phosphate isomerase/epimerase